MKPKTDNTKLIASYFAAAFGVLQIVDIVIDRLGFPVILINYLLYAIVSGFIGILLYSFLPFFNQDSSIGEKTKKSALRIIGITVIFVLSISNIFFFRESNINTLKQEAYATGFKRIDKMIDSEDYIGAFNLANQYFQKISSDSLIIEKLNETSLEVEIRSKPDNAEVFFKDIDSDEWNYLGDTPLITRIPGLNSQARGFIDFKIKKEGYTDYRSLTTAGLIRAVSLSKELNYFELTALEDSKKNMVRIPGGRTKLFVSELGDLNAINLKPFWIDRFEVSNADYQKFINDGGYKDKALWDEIFDENKNPVKWKDAMRLFVDESGLNGPSTWSNGTYRSGQANYPVMGVSWYEARAYAKWSGKSIPTIYHWYKAAMKWGESTAISPRSNFSGVPSEVGKYNTVSTYGCYDMAGNAREWGTNPHLNGNKTMMGGGYNDEPYFFTDNFSVYPINRYKTNGFRCVIVSDSKEVLLSADTLIQSFTRDFYTHKPISDEVFSIYNGMFKYDKSPLNVTIIKESEVVNDAWQKKVIEIDAAYNDERLPLNIFTPTNSSPPYKTVIYVPGSNAITTRNSQNLTANYFGFLLRSGYALIRPIFKGTYERGYSEFPNYVENESKIYADQLIMMVKDYSRAIDYVEEQDELLNDIYYYGISWGGMLGPLFLANENRIKKSVWQVAGLGARKTRPEGSPLTFLSRVNTPVLMLNGIYDQYFPFETSQKPMYDLLSLKEPMKKMITYESAHSPPSSETSKEILKWFRD